MSQSTRARHQVAQAARNVIRARGVRSLTLEALASSSEATRGGIRYHWPSRRAPVRSLIEHNLAARGRQVCDLSTDDAGVAGEIRCMLDPRNGVGTLGVCLLPEARDEEETWERMRQAKRALLAP